MTDPKQPEQPDDQHPDPFVEGADDLPEDVRDGEVKDEEVADGS